MSIEMNQPGPGLNAEQPNPREQVLADYSALMQPHIATLESSSRLHLDSSGPLNVVYDTVAGFLLDPYADLLHYRSGIWKTNLVQRMLHPRETRALQGVLEDGIKIPNPEDPEEILTVNDLYMYRQRPYKQRVELLGRDNNGKPTLLETYPISPIDKLPKLEPPKLDEEYPRLDYRNRHSVEQTISGEIYRVHTEADQAQWGSERNLIAAKVIGTVLTAACEQADLNPKRIIKRKIRRAVIDPLLEETGSIN